MPACATSSAEIPRRANMLISAELTLGFDSCFGHAEFMPASLTSAGLRMKLRCCGAMHCGWPRVVLSSLLCWFEQGKYTFCFERGMASEGVAEGVPKDQRKGLWKGLNG